MLDKKLIRLWEQIYSKALGIQDITIAVKNKKAKPFPILLSITQGLESCVSNLASLVTASKT